ncbi:MAG: hypothetical protein WC719_03580 [Patescibacteria group bacterium]|jgi:hypothetical protein
MKKTLFFLAMVAIIATGCSKKDDSFNPDNNIIQEANDSVTFRLSFDLLTPFDWDRYYANACIVSVILDDGTDFFQVDLNSYTAVTLKGDNAKMLIGKEVLITPEVNVFYVYSWQPYVRSEYFKTSFDPAPARFIVEKNKSYDFNFDVAFTPL